MTDEASRSTVEELNAALGACRQLALRLFTVGVGDLVAVLLLALVSAALAEVGLIALLGLIVFAFSAGLRIARALGEPTTALLPVLLIPTGVTTIARRANAMGMEWTGFFGPLRPQRRR